MTRRIAILLLAFLAPLPCRVSADEAGETDKPMPATVLLATDAQAIRAAKGKTVLVRGKVARSHKAKATGVNFLDFASGDFTVVTFGRDLAMFPDGEPADTYKDKIIEVRGEITFYEDEPQIVLSAPQQIRVIDENTLAATKVAAQPKVAPTPDGENPAEAEAATPKAVDPRKYFTD